MDARKFTGFGVAAAVLLAGCLLVEEMPARPVLASLSSESAGVADPAGEVGFAEEGLASWYGAELAGAKTASGEPFDPEALTAAHPELPFGTAVTVTNLDNGQEVVLVINDRGPKVDDRIIDVSQAAARLLGFKEDGTAQVRVEASAEALAAARALAEET